MARKKAFEVEVLAVNSQVTTAASQMLDRLMGGAVGRVELDLGSHVLEMLTKKKRVTRKKAATTVKRKAVTTVKSKATRAKRK